jgi:glycosyltransferase involved in cell wall biosynthesis
VRLKGWIKLTMIGGSSERMMARRVGGRETASWAMVCYDSELSRSEMKIYLPILGFTRTGGARVLAELASAWKRMGHDAVFLANQYSQPPYFPTTAQIYWLDDEGRRLEGPGPKGAERGGALGLFRNLRSLRRALNRYARPGDAVMANQSFTAWPVFLNRSGAAAFYYVQAYEAQKYLERRTLSSTVLFLLSVGTYYLPLRRIVNSNAYRRYRSLRAEHVVPPGLDFSVFHPGAAQGADLADRTVVLGCVGRKEPSKGTPYVVDAFKLLLARGCDARLRIAYGNVPPEIAEHPRCEVVVPANDRELADFYRSLDILIAPVWGEHDAPLYPVMEGMACGVPVITTHFFPATPDNAALVPVRDAKGIADAVETVISEDAARRRARVEKGLATVRPFGWPEVAGEMLRLLKT